MEHKLRMNVDQTGLAHIMLSNPPYNALGPELLGALSSALSMASENDAVKAVLIGATGQNFSTGGGHREAETAPSVADLGQICQQIEESTKPVIAAVHGAALSAGGALALACHYRIASKNSFLGFPEVNLGMVPEGGVTQRLPRIAGASVTLELLLVGRTISGHEAQRVGIVDRLVPDHLGQEAKRWGHEIIAEGAPLRPTRDRTDGLADPKAYQQALQDYRAKVAGQPVQAATQIVECVEAAQLLPFESGLALEAELAEDCAASPQARALRHLQLAEQRLARLPSLTPFPGEITRVAILGSGAVAAGWVVVCLDAGIPVILPQVETADDLRMRVVAIYNAAMLKDRLTEEQRGERLARLREGPAHEADLLIDCAGTALGALEDELPETMVLAQSGQPAQMATMPELGSSPRAVQLQVPMPVHRTRLVELLINKSCSDATRLRLARLMKRLNRAMITSPAEGGGIGAAVWGACVYAADQMVRAGVAPEAVDEALSGYGFARTPYRKRTPPQAEAEARSLSADEIVVRVLAAMANTGALLIEGGLALRPGDIDLAMVNGYGFPRWHGGPMILADERGLLRLRNYLRALCDEDPEFWAPSDLFSELIKNGRHFADMDG